ncbi:PRC-barrel domain-containing protein [Rhodoligotrophos defluvii]|uniref:PRC-barrel domain-containing protein n=1 Tax=Rhodoligotrophos defluvii TaxID=2561934 RepID=UPI0019617BE4|nr:PRC-barrel domain-containing protein [Rhodoligotrophos defluvii]
MIRNGPSLVIAAVTAMGICYAVPAEAQNQQKVQQSESQPQTGQEQQADQQGDRPPVLVLEEWSYAPLYAEGWSAERLIDADVFGMNGEEIGEVENLIVSDKGRLLGIIAEVGGFLDIGDTHVLIPWDQASISPDLGRVTVPLTEDNLPDYSPFRVSYLQKNETGYTHVVEEDLEAGPRIWKATELLNDDAYLNGDVGYGNVSDLIFTTDGNLRAVVVSADSAFGGGYYAYPFYGYGYGWNPGVPYYGVGYDRAEIATLEQFDYDELKTRVDLHNDALTTGSTGEDRQPQSQGSRQTDQTE